MALVVKNLPANARDIRNASSILGSGRPSGGGNGNALQYSCLEDPTDREAWWTTVYRVGSQRVRHDWRGLASMHTMIDIIRLDTICWCLVAQLCLNLLQPRDWACQAPLSVGFSRQEYWRGLPFPSPGDLPNLGIEPTSPALAADSLLLNHQRHYLSNLWNL